MDLPAADLPTYGEETSRGFYLRDGGYYFAINDYMDLKVLGEVYTKGSWGINATYNYNWRYKFAGSLFFSYQKYIDEGQPIDGFCCPSSATPLLFR